MFPYTNVFLYVWYVFLCIWYVFLYVWYVFLYVWYVFLYSGMSFGMTQKYTTLYSTEIYNTIQQNTHTHRFFKGISKHVSRGGVGKLHHPLV